MTETEFGVPKAEQSKTNLNKLFASYLGIKTPSPTKHT
jgi:hypothetical protein